MASIDKIYTNSYKEYREFKDWADTQYVTFFDGYKVCIGNWVWNIKEKDFKGQEIPILNSPTWVDTYLIQNCKVEFVLNRMKQVYSEEGFEILKSKSITHIPTGFKKNRKVTIKRNSRTLYPIHNKAYDGYKWWLQCEGGLWYNEDTKTWAEPDMYPFHNNTAHIKTVKAIIRHLRKQYLPSGIEFCISGKYIGEEYIIYIH